MAIKQLYGPIQVFLQAVLLMSVFWTKIEFSNVVNADEGVKVLYTPQEIQSGALMEVHGVKLLKEFDRKDK